MRVHVQMPGLLHQGVFACVRAHICIQHNHGNTHTDTDACVYLHVRPKSTHKQ